MNEHRTNNMCTSLWGKTRYKHCGYGRHTESRLHLPLTHTHQPPASSLLTIQNNNHST